MRHHLFSIHESNQYPVALLLKPTAFLKQDLLNNYVAPLGQMGVPPEEVVAFTLAYNEAGKAPASFAKEYATKLLRALDSLQTKYLYVADAGYFKVLAGQTKADPHLGYAMPCKIKGYEHMTVVLGVNYQQLIYNPELIAKLNLSLQTLAAIKDGSYEAIGTRIIHSARYPENTKEIAETLLELLQYPRLACDIEGFNLRYDKAGIGTIAFAWDQHNGVAFACDYSTFISHEEMVAGLHGSFHPNQAIRSLLREFFESYQGELTFHHCTYDVKCIIAALWMENLLDTEGLLHGLEIMTRKMHDSKIITYLATNTTAGNQLGLKTLAHEFAGNWAVEEIKDIRKIPKSKLLEYNLVDTLSTNYVRDKYEPIMEADQQGELYRGLFKDSLKLIIQMELTGMPMSRQRIQEVKAELEAIQQTHLTVITTNPIVKGVELLLQDGAWESDYETRKSKAKNPDKIKQKDRTAFDDVRFNPNSGPQLQKLLYEHLGLPVIDYTDTKQPATGADTLEKLVNHTQEPAYKELLEALIAYGKVTKILSTFIPAFEEGIDKADGMKYLHGSFNLGGTVSGRLSSSDPNLQNIPAGSDYGKAIKTCFSGPDGWLFCGADFNALEARIDALTTKDKNKLAVYIDGMDSHSFNALTYWPDKVPNISEYLTPDRLSEQHYRVEYSDGTFEYLPESLINANT